MLYTIFSIAIIMASIICFTILVVDFNGLFSNKFLKGKTTFKVIKLVVPFVCVLLLFSIGTIYFYTNGNERENIIAIEIYRVLSYTIKSLVFEIKDTSISLLIDNNKFYYLAWCIAYPLCVITSYVNILNLISHRIINKICVRIALRNSCDILIGMDYAKIYKKKSNNNIILWVDEEITKEKELELISLGIPYINKPFKLKSILTIPKLRKSVRSKIRNLKNKTLKKELKHYNNKRIDFVDYLLNKINKSINLIFEKYILNKNDEQEIDNHSKCEIFKLSKNISLICNFIENEELNKDNKKLVALVNNDNSELAKIKYFQEVLKNIQSCLSEKGFDEKLCNELNRVFKSNFSNKDLMMKFNEQINKEAKYALLKVLKERYPFECKEVDYHFISFKDEETNLKYLSEFKLFLQTSKCKIKIYETRNYFLHVELTSSNLMSIQNKIQEDFKNLSPFLLFFNRYQLNSIKFHEENPITKYLPNSFINEFGAIENNNFDIKYELDLKIDSEVKKCNLEEKNKDLKVKTIYEKNINVLYFGFGKVSRELHKLSVMNNQLVSYCTDNSIPPMDRYHNHVINYFAVDKETLKSGDKNNLYFNNRFDNIKDDLSQNDYYEFPEDTSKFYALDSDINNVNTYKALVKLLKYRNDLTYNQIIISLDNDLENIDYALKVLMLLKQECIENYHIFVRLQKENKGVIELLMNKNVSFFGYLTDIFNHEIIVKDSLMNLAKLTNSSYNRIKLSNTNWYNLTPIKQKSNLYASVNIRLKLNLLGYDYIRLSKEDFKNLSKEDLASHKTNIIELNKKLSECHEKYEDYLFYKKDNLPNISNILSFQEHSRWNAFYLGFGYIPMKINDVKIDNNKVKKDDDTLKQHICLTTYQDLDLWHHKFAELLSQINDKPIEENLINEQTYQYDYMLVGQFESLFEDLEKNKLLLIKK